MAILFKIYPGGCAVLPLLLFFARKHGIGDALFVTADTFLALLYANIQIYLKSKTGDHTLCTPLKCRVFVPGSIQHFYHFNSSSNNDEWLPI
jgi:hypothetical protein